MIINFNADNFACDETTVRIIFNDILSIVHPNHSDDPKVIDILPSPCENPFICKISDDRYLVYLSAHENYWSKYAYQFAHEICHYRINGDFSGDIIGLCWLEETICELASQYCQIVLSALWSARAHPFHSAMRDYALDLIRETQPLGLSLSGYIKEHQEELEQPQYHRNLYSNMASALLPLTLFPPMFWMLLPYFGDMKRYRSLHEFLQTLVDRAPEGLKDVAVLFCRSFL